MSEFRQLKQLDEKNASSKKMGADLILNKHMLQEVIVKKL